MSLCNSLNHICNQLAGWQAVVHPLMPHCNTIANARYAKEKWIASTCMHTLFNKTFKITHSSMAWNNVCKTCGNPYKWLIHFSFWDTCCIKKSPVWNALNAFFDFVASHSQSFLLDFAG